MDDEKRENKLDMERWTRFAEASAKEKSWMHDRLNWLFIPQGVFFTALAWVFKLQHDMAPSPGEWPSAEAISFVLILRVITFVLLTLGLLISLGSLMGLIAAGRMHFRWTTMLNILCKRLNRNKPVIPFGMEPYWPARTSSVVPAFIASMFVVAWGAIIACVSQVEFQRGHYGMGSILFVSPLTVILIAFVFVAVLDAKSSQRLRDTPQAVVFDLDGVLVDSLPAHLKICDDLQEKWGLELEIPGDRDAFRRKVGNQPISPMEKFFLSVGFPPEKASEADKVYKQTFNDQYPVRVFPGVDDLLERLGDEALGLGIPMGIVTSNTRKNTEGALGEDLLKRFDKRCIFTEDSVPRLDKAGAIRRAAEEWGLETGDILYVGDQPNDREAARRAGCAFVGAGYGWLSLDGKGDRHPYVVVNDRRELFKFICRQFGFYTPESKPHPIRSFIMRCLAGAGSEPNARNLGRPW